MFDPQPSDREQLDGGLVVRSLETTEDVERLAVFNGQIHSASEVTFTRRLVQDHPNTTGERWLFVEDTGTGRIVSTLCLIPWDLEIGSVAFRSAEMGIVGTLPDYRGRGLIRALTSRFQRLLMKQGFLMSHIQGIPGFYGRFGYAHAVPLIPDLRVTIEIARAVAKNAAPLMFRAATAADIPTLSRLHERVTAPLTLTSSRSPEIWRYLLEGPSVDEGETWLFSRGVDEEPQGYFRVHKTGFGDGVNVSEVSLPGAWAAGALLGRLAAIAADWKRPYIKLEIDPECDLAVLARDLGGQYLANYAWQIRFPDLPRFLRAIAPVLEERLVHSMFAGLTERVIISDYRSLLALGFRDGKVVSVDRPGTEEEAGARIPWDCLAPLLTGYRSVDELAAADHDFGVRGRQRTLLRTLFPKSRAYFYTIY